KNIRDNDLYRAMLSYVQGEVDECIDKIIQDDEAFEKEIEKLQQKNQRLKKGTDQTRSRASGVTPNANQQVNYDVLKRLSNLEKAVFGKKYPNSEADEA